MGYMIQEYNITPEGKCPKCQTSIPGIWPCGGEEQVHTGKGMTDYYSRFPRRVSVN
jgi:hypothetical protein